MTDTKELIQYSLILSVSDTQQTIETDIRAALDSLFSMGKPAELVVVDDASTDGTYEKILEIARDDSRVRVLRMRSGFGEAAALDAGFRHSRGQLIGFLSTRVNVKIAGLPDLFLTLENGYDLVIGRRFPRRDSLLNRLVSGFFNRIVNGLCHLQLKDINSGVFVIKREVLDRIAVYGDLNHFLPVLATQQGYKVTETVIEQLPGEFRVSRYPNEYIRRFLDIVTVFFLTRYSKKPIHFMGFLGTLCFLTGLGIEIYLFVYRILQMGPIAGRPLLILGALLLVIGIQMISIGLLGEMVIFTHAGDIEEYNIEEVING